MDFLEGVVNCFAWLLYACPYVAIFNPRLFLFELNLFAFKFKLHVQNLFKFKTNSYSNFVNLFNTSLKFLFNLAIKMQPTNLQSEYIKNETTNT